MYTDTKNTNDYTNNYVGKTTNDIFHKFTITCPMQITISHCGSGLSDTYVWLLNESGNLITNNDDGYFCAGYNYQSYLSKELFPGTYYVVSEGYSQNGSITLNLSGSMKANNTVPNTDKNYILTTTPYIAVTDISQLSQYQASRTIQYFDGLGRPVQTVQRGAGGQGQDLITATEYDGFGREWKSYLPIPVTGNNGAYVDGILTKAKSAYGNDNYPFSEIVYEQSPLNRVKEQYGPGQNWRNGYHSVKTNYLTNNTTDNYLKCTYYSVSNNSLAKNGNYASNQLYVTEMIDEDGNKSYEFKDKQGQVVLTRQINNGENHDTYYVYDDFGNLCYVLPPLAVDKLTNFSDENEVMKQYAYIYKYDYRNRCIEKKLPGADWIYSVYDKADRLILTQDGNQRAETPKKWTFNKYDIFGRLLVSGVYSDNSTRSGLESEFRDSLIVEKTGGCLLLVGKATMTQAPQMELIAMYMWWDMKR